MLQSGYSVQVHWSVKKQRKIHLQKGLIVPRSSAPNCPPGSGILTANQISFPLVGEHKGVFPA
jgi:hypothetical protein